jgi:hypothetical protein
MMIIIIKTKNKAEKNEKKKNYIKQKVYMNYISYILSLYTQTINYNLVIYSFFFLVHSAIVVILHVYLFIAL